MPDKKEKHVTLDVDAWLDAPASVFEVLRAVKTQTVTIDASTQTPLGAQLAQLLLSAKRTALENEGDLRIQNPSQQFKQSIQVLGLMDEFEGLLV